MGQTSRHFIVMCAGNDHGLGIIPTRGIAEFNDIETFIDQKVAEHFSRSGYATAIEHLNLSSIGDKGRGLRFLFFATLQGQKNDAEKS